MSAFANLPDAFVRAFGTTVTVEPNGQPSREIQAIFKRPSEIDFGETSVVVQTTYIRARSTDVADLQRKDRVIVNGTEYQAEAPEPDTRGMTHIPLSLP